MTYWIMVGSLLLLVFSIYQVESAIRKMETWLNEFTIRDMSDAEPDAIEKYYDELEMRLNHTSKTFKIYMVLIGIAGSGLLTTVVIATIQAMAK